MLRSTRRRPTLIASMLRRDDLKSSFSMWVALAIVALVIFATRYAIFSGVEPRIDQAYFASSMRDLASADHMLPRDTARQGFRQALERDTSSALYAIARPIYASPQFALELLPFGLGSVCLYLVGYSYTHVVALSILTSAITLIPVTVLFRRSTHAPGLSGLSGALFYASSSYVALYSPWGVHNFGVFMLVLAIALGTRLMPASANWTNFPNRRIAALAAITVLGAYSHFTNTLLLPLTFLLSLVALRQISFRRKIQIATLYCFIVFIGVAPVGIASIMFHKTQSSFLVYANVGNSLSAYLSGMPQRAVLWFAYGTRLFSIPGLLTGILGLAWMTSVTRIRLPMCFLIAHFTCYCLAPGFIWNGSSTYLRTYNYVIPFFAVGMGWILLQMITPGTMVRRHRTLFALIGMCLAWHLATQLPRNGYEAWARRHTQDFATDYLDGQGELRPIVGSIEQVVGTDPVLFWNFSERFAYISLAKDTRTVLPSALDSSGPGVQVLNSRMPANGYVLAIASDSFSRGDLSAAVGKIHGRPAEVRLLSRWPCSIPDYGPFALYWMQFR